MKYLIKHTKELILTIIMIVVIAYVLYNGIKHGQPVQSIIEAVTYVLVWYYNMPTSIDGDIAKIDMKQRKATRHCGYEGAPEPEDAEVE